MQGMVLLGQKMTPFSAGWLASEAANHLQTSMSSLVLMPWEEDRAIITTFLQTLYQIICRSGSFWVQGGNSLLSDSSGILLLWVYLSNLLHQFPASRASVPLPISSRNSGKLQNHFSVFVSNLQPAINASLYQVTVGSNGKNLSGTPGQLESHPRSNLGWQCSHPHFYPGCRTERLILI